MMAGQTLISVRYCQSVIRGHLRPLCVMLVLVVLIGGIEAGTCYSVCSWSAWEQWGTCTKTCGGGLRQRTRPLCCPTHHTGSMCLLYCSKSSSDASETGDCNEFCCRGTFTGSRCSCPDTHHGTCCEHKYTQPGNSNETSTDSNVTTTDASGLSTTAYDFCPAARTFREPGSDTTTSKPSAATSTTSQQFTIWILLQLLLFYVEIFM